MDAPDRRRLLAAIGSAGAASLLAGCGDAPLDGTPRADIDDVADADGDPGKPLRRRRPSSTNPGMVDGAATVEDADGNSCIEYDADAETLTVTLFT